MKLTIKASFSQKKMKKTSLFVQCFDYPVRQKGLKGEYLYESFILVLCVVDLKQKNVYGFLCKKRIIKFFL